MNAKCPLFSIVIPTLNAGVYLRGALESIATQSFQSFEVLLVDGGSTDNTLDIADAFDSQITCLRRLREDSGGVYGAINSGIAAASGDWVLVLGSDDRLHQPDTLLQAADRISRTSSTIVYGDVVIQGNNRYMAEGERYAGRLTLSDLATRNVCQQAIFYRIELFIRTGGFQAKFRTCADWVFLLENYMSERPEWIDLVVAEYHAGGLSSRTVDHEFLIYRPMLLLRIMLSNLLNDEAQEARVHLRIYSTEFRRAGRRVRSAFLLFGWCVLTIVSRLPKLRPTEARI